MGESRNLFKKIGNSKGKFHAKMGTIKERNGKDLRDTEEIKKRQQEYTEELYQKGLNDPDNHDGVITHLDPDILECKVKCVGPLMDWNLVVRSRRRESVRRKEANIPWVMQPAFAFQGISQKQRDKEKERKRKKERKTQGPKL